MVLYGLEVLYQDIVLILLCVLVGKHYYLLVLHYLVSMQALILSFKLLNSPLEICLKGAAHPVLDQSVERLARERCGVDLVPCPLINFFYKKNFGVPRTEPGDSARRPILF